MDPNWCRSSFLYLPICCSSYSPLAGYNSFSELGSYNIGKCPTLIVLLSLSISVIINFILTGKILECSEPYQNFFILIIEACRTLSTMDLDPNYLVKLLKKYQILFSERKKTRGWVLYNQGEWLDEEERFFQGGIGSVLLAISTIYPISIPLLRIT